MQRSPSSNATRRVARLRRAGAGSEAGSSPARPAGGSRLGIEGQRRRVLTGALQVLGSRPYQEVSVQDVLDAAGVSRQTFYRCFANKTEVYHQVFREGNAMFLAAIRSLDKSGADAVQVAERALDGALLFVRFGGAVLRALYAETVRPGSEFAAYRREVLDALVADVLGWSGKNQMVAADPMVVRAVLLVVEQLLFELASQPDPTPEAIARTRDAILLIVRGTHDELRRRATSTAARDGTPHR